jgi:hypothetical protein
MQWRRVTRLPLFSDLVLPNLLPTWIGGGEEGGRAEAGVEQMQ